MRDPIIDRALKLAEQLHTLPVPGTQDRGWAMPWSAILLAAAIGYAADRIPPAPLPTLRR